MRVLSHILSQETNEKWQNCWLVWLFIGKASVEQEFPVALRADDRALDDTNHRPARLRRNPGGGALANRVMHCGIAHHAAFADMLAAGLELRFDEGHELGLFSGEGERRRQ